MKQYKVIYSGNSTRFKNFSRVINAESERNAVVMVYAEHLDSNYFPQEDGSIKDCDGERIADPSDDSIWYDGGLFSAEEI